MRVNFPEINRTALARIDDVISRFLPGGRRQRAEYAIRNPTRADAHPGSFKVNCITGKWSDFATGESGKDPISLIAYLETCKQGEAAKHLATFLGIHTPARSSRIVATFIFHNADGSEAYQKERYEPKAFSFYRIIDGQRQSGSGGVHRLYRLPEVLRAGMVLFFEGEGKADIAAAWGFCGTSLDTGAKSKLTPEQIEQLSGRHVVILPDNDAPGREYGSYLARTLHGKAATVKLVTLPGLGEKGDIKNWAKLPGNDAALLREIIEAEEEWRPTEPEPARTYQTPESDNPPRKSGGKRAEAAELLLFLALGLPMLVDNLGNPYTVVEQKVIRVEAAESWLTWEFYKQTGGYPTADSMKGIIRLMAAKARYEGERVTLYNRVGVHNGAFVIDLGQGRCARITPDMVTIEAPPAIFRSFPHQQPAPDPDLNGNPWRFLEFCNVAVERRLVVMVSLIAAFVPGIIHPLFMVHGPARSGKSHFCKFFKKVIDPSSIELQFLQDDDLKDLFATLGEHYVYCPDNVSKLSSKISDIFCQAVTGVSVSQRLYYTNTDTVQINLKNIILLNGIPTLLNRADLNDRAISLFLDRLRDDQLQGESIINARFDTALPEILGGCLRTLSKAMAIGKELYDFTSPVRLHDFARWGFCIAEALGGQGNRFLEDLKRDYRSQADDLIENNLLATVLIECMGTYGPKWDTTAQTAYSILMDTTHLDKKDLLRDPSFPHKVQDLRRQLDRLRPVLEEWGITYRYGLRSKYGVPLTITQTQPTESAAPPADPVPEVADHWGAADFEVVP